MITGTYRYGCSVINPDGTDVFIKDNGKWHPIQYAWTKKDGHWKLVNFAIKGHDNKWSASSGHRYI